MNHYPESLLNLIRNLSRLPGIGEKTAERLAMHLLRAPRQEVEALAVSISQLREKIQLCAECFSLSDDHLCRICRNPARDPGVLCVVEQPADMVAIEKSGSFSGRYHVLQGVLSPMDGIGPDNIRIRELMQRIEKQPVKEVVLATSTSTEGEATALYLAGLLKAHPVAVTRIASGIPMGGDLKYVDQVTLKRAMEARRKL